jgi:hypothetical protein
MCRLRLLLCASVSLWLVTATAIASAETVVPVDDKPFEAKFQAADDRWSLQFVAPSGEVRTLPAGELVQWGTWPEAKVAKQILFVDGGVLAVADVLGIKDDKLTAESDTLVSPTVRLPISTVAGLLYQAPLNPRRRDALEDKVFNAIGDSDRVLLANGDELKGMINALSDKGLQLKTAAGTTPIDISRLSGLIFNPSLRAKALADPRFAWIGLRDGSRLRASKLVTNAKGVELTLSGNALIQVPLDAVIAIQPIGGQVVYLSELSPAGYRHIPYLSLPWEYQNNRSAGKAALRTGGQRQLLGLGMHSAARLTYDLDAPYRRFDASLAIDDETVGLGSVVGRVFTDDGSGEWKPRCESPIVRGGEAPVPVSVDLAGAKRISLLIDFADRGDEGDHANWLNARLVK